MNIPMDLGWDLDNYRESVEWDIVKAPATKFYKHYPCCPCCPYAHINFNLVIRRRTLYYAVNLILPCACINMLTILAFYLPPDADGKKISVCISIFLSLGLFQLLLMDIVPASSLSTPLLGKYLSFTTALVTFSVFFSTLVININYRSSSTHRMSRWSRLVFLEVLPRYLFMDQADLPPLSVRDIDPAEGRTSPDQNATPMGSGFMSPGFDTMFVGFPGSLREEFCQACVAHAKANYPPNAQKALEGIGFMAERTKGEIESKAVSRYA